MNTGLHLSSPTAPATYLHPGAATGGESDKSNFSTPGAGPSSVNALQIPTVPHFESYHFSTTGSHSSQINESSSTLEADQTAPGLASGSSAEKLPSPQEVDELIPPSPGHSTSTFRAPCPGQWVHWVPGSVWDTYAYHQHERPTMAWTLEGIDGERVRLRAKQCEGLLQTENELNNGNCMECHRLLTSESLARFMQQATGEALPHTPWLYLNHHQSSRLMVDMSKRIRRLNQKVRNLRLLEMINVLI
jgi:hypothetical protein